MRPTASCLASQHRNPESGGDPPTFAAIGAIRIGAPCAGRCCGREATGEPRRAIFPDRGCAIIILLLLSVERAQLDVCCANASVGCRRNQELQSGALVCSCKSTRQIGGIARRSGTAECLRRHSDHEIVLCLLLEAAIHPSIHIY